MAPGRIMKLIGSSNFIPTVLSARRKGSGAYPF
jgi:hypothetical protein